MASKRVQQSYRESVQAYRLEQERLMQEFSDEMRREAQQRTVQPDETSCSLDGMTFETHNGCSVPMR